MKTRSDSQAGVDIGGTWWRMADFLRLCAASLDGDVADPADAIDRAARASAPSWLAELRDAFVAGGLGALRAGDRPADDWVQYNVEVSRPTPELYGVLAVAAEEALSDGVVDDLFFVHKPPGLRLRYRVTPGDRPRTVVRLERLAVELAERDLVTGWRPAIYEPEHRLFGGPVSMRSVHRLFTADSLAWLGFHQSAAQTSSMTTWAMSLLMIRSLLDALQIVGWEDIDVWDRLGRDCARMLAADVADDPRTQRIAGALRHGWANPDALRERLPESAYSLLDRHERAIRTEAKRWIADYFTAPGALIGPRQAAAFVVVFHWNRGGLPPHHQALIADLLASRKPGARA